MTPPTPFGVYVTRSGKLKVFEEDEKHWIIDEGQIRNHPLFRIREHVVHQMTKGWPVLEWGLKNCEYLGPL